MGAIIAWIRSLFLPAIEKKPDAWLIDRDGRVYKPERKIVLKARSTN